MVPFEAKLRERLEIASLSKGDAFDFAAHLTNIALALSTEAQDMLNCADGMRLSQSDREAFKILIRKCDVRVKFRSVGDDKFNPFPCHVVDIPVLSRSPQVCEV